MNLKNMLGAASLNKEEEKSLAPMVTLWGENLDRKNVLSEYPRPQMRRKNYVMLNGIWEYRILTGDLNGSVREKAETEESSIRGNLLEYQYYQDIGSRFLSNLRA